MTEPSDEIMERATELLNSFDEDDMSRWVDRRYAIARAIMEAEERGAAREREECAKVAESFCGAFEPSHAWPSSIAAAIRARGQPTHYPVMKPYLELGSFTREELKEAIEKVMRKGSE